MFSTVISTTQPGFILPGRLSAVRCCSVSVSSKQLRSTQFDLKTYWTKLIAEIDQNLDRAIPIKYPEGIYEAMRYSVLAKGAKRAPPVMCVAACELFGGNRLAAFPTACALEMVRLSLLLSSFEYYLEFNWIFYFLFFLKYGFFFILKFLLKIQFWSEWLTLFS